MGVSVTRRISQIKQPRGGYLNPKELTVIELPTHKALKEENVHPSLVGLAVDYLTRYCLTGNAEKAFTFSLIGAEDWGYIKDAKRLLNNIKNPLDEESVIAAVKLCGYDVLYRVGPAAYRPVEEIMPDKDTINNILEMVKRSLNFFSKYGPIISDGFDFSPKGYTETVSAGDGDFLTKDTLWDFKVSEKEPTNKQTLQLLMYWIMGLHSQRPEFKTIQKIGIFNPRLNIIFTYDLKKISKDTIQEIENDVICY